MVKKADFLTLLALHASICVCVAQVYHLREVLVELDVLDIIIHVCLQKMLIN